MLFLRVLPGENLFLRVTLAWSSFPWAAVKEHPIRLRVALVLHLPNLLQTRYNLNSADPKIDSIAP
jgi:hypothetical protein